MAISLNRSIRHSNKKLSDKTFPRYLDRSGSGRILEQNSLFYGVHKVNKVKVSGLI